MVISGDNDGDGAGETRLFVVNAVSASLKNMTLEKGYAYNYGAAGCGGAIYNGGGTLTVTNTTFVTNNSAYHSDYPSRGGAICNGSGAMLTIADSTFSSNSASDVGGGGAIYNAGTLDVTGGTFSSNSAGGGGGIVNDGTLTVTDSTFSGNSADNWGGAIMNTSYGVMTVTDSTFSGNSSTGNSWGNGGGIYNEGGMTVTNSTFSDNSANRGGALYNDGGSAQFTNNTFVGNYPGASNNPGGTFYVAGGSLALYNNIISSSPSYSSTCYAVSPSSLTGSNNLNNRGCGSTSSSSNYLPGRIFTGNLQPSSMLLGPLGDNGGPTQTFALLPGSPAIDAGDDSACPATDQRGVARPIGAHCDIGAVESPLIDAITVTSEADDGSGSLRHAILGLAPGGTITFDGDYTIHLASELDLYRGRDHRRWNQHSHDQWR